MRGETYIGAFDLMVYSLVWHFFGIWWALGILAVFALAELLFKGK